MMMVAMLDDDDDDDDAGTRCTYGPLTSSWLSRCLLKDQSCEGHCTNTEARVQHDRTALWWSASIQGPVEVVKWLVKAEASPVHSNQQKCPSKDMHLVSVTHHAKAGNINNALMNGGTSGDFIVVFGHGLV